MKKYRIRVNRGCDEFYFTAERRVLFFFWKTLFVNMKEGTPARYRTEEEAIDAIRRYKNLVMETTSETVRYV